MSGSSRRIGALLWVMLLSLLLLLAWFIIEFRKVPAPLAEPVRPEAPSDLIVDSDENLPPVPIVPRPFDPIAFTSDTVFRIKDTITGKAISGARLFSDPEGAVELTPGHSSAKGEITIGASGYVWLTQPVFARIEQLAPGKVFAVILDGVGDRVLKISVYARLSIKLPPVQGVAPEPEDSNGGFLWCVTWPTPEAILQGQEDAHGRLFWKHRQMTIESHSPSAQSVDYHDAVRQIPGCDTTQLHIVRETHPPGAESVIDLPYEGGVVLDYYLPSSWTARTLVNLTRGESHDITMEPAKTKKVTIKVVDTLSQPVSGARLVLVQRKSIAEDETMPPHVGNLFIPHGTKQLIAYQRGLATTGDDGRASCLVSACDEIFVSIASPQVVGTGLLLWQGPGIPGENELTAVVKRAPAGDECLVTIGGKPLADFEGIDVADLKPRASFMGIKFGLFRTDARGLLDLSQLTPGHEYAMQFTGPTGHQVKSFTYTPNMKFEF